MKNLPLHVFYLSIIGILSFQLWSKTTVDNRAFEQVEKVLEEDFSLSAFAVDNLKMATTKNARAYPTPNNLNILKKYEENSPQPLP